MKGWTEEEFRNRELMAPCGLYCGTCGVYLATRDGNEKFKAVMGNLYGTKPEETGCLGCMQPDPPKKIYGFCKACKIRSCVKSKGYYSCHQCGEWPCDLIENFIFATGVKVMKRAAPNGRGRNANDTTALPAVSPSFEGPIAAGRAKNPWPTSWMDLCKD